MKLKWIKLRETQTQMLHTAQLNVNDLLEKAKVHKEEEISGCQGQEGEGVHYKGEVQGKFGGVSYSTFWL